MRDDSACLAAATTAADAAATSLRDATITTTAFGPTASPSGFALLAGEWNNLVRRSRFNNFFSTHEWQTTWWEHLGEGELWILAFRRADTGALVGLAPLYLLTMTGEAEAGRRQFNLVGCIEVSDYLDLIIEEGWEAPVYRAFYAWLAGPEAPPWDTLDLCNLPEVSQTYHELPVVLANAGLDVEVFQEDTAPQFSLPLRFEEYLQHQVDKKQRHEIRRKQRRAEREVAVDFILVDQRHTIEAEVDDFVALQRASRADKADFMTPAMRRFFLAVARRMLEVDRLRLFFLALDGEKAATLFAFEYDRRFWLYNSGYDPDAHAALSPGWVLLAYAIQYAIACGSRVFDFMQGNEEYKYRFGAQDYRVMRIVARRPV